MKFRISNLSE